MSHRPPRAFTLLLSDVGMLTLLPRIAARLAEIAPALALAAIPLDSRHFAAKLEFGEADLALGAFAKAPRGLRRQSLYADGYLGVVRIGHPSFPTLRSRAGFRAGRRIIVTASDTGHSAHRLVQEALDAEVAPTRVMLRVPSFIAAAHLAATSDGAAVIPARLANALAAPLGLAVFRPPLALPPIEIAQYWHERLQRDPGHCWLRALSFELFSNPKRDVRLRRPHPTSTSTSTSKARIA